MFFDSPLPVCNLIYLFNRQAFYVYEGAADIFQGRGPAAPLVYAPDPIDFMKMKCLHEIMILAYDDP